MANGLFIERLGVESELQKLVTTSDWEVSRSFGSERRRREYLSWRSIVYRELGHDAQIEYNSVGAPIVSNRNGIFIGVSHCSEYVAVIISPSPCAVDVESTSRNYARIESRYISNKEMQISDTGLYPAVVWCAKEALYKLSGERGLDFIEDLHVEDYLDVVVVGRIKDREKIQLSVATIDDDRFVVVSYPQF